MTNTTVNEGEKGKEKYDEIDSLLSSIQKLINPLAGHVNVQEINSMDIIDLKRPLDEPETRDHKNNLMPPDQIALNQAYSWEMKETHSTKADAHWSKNTDPALDHALNLAEGEQKLQEKLELSQSVYAESQQAITSFLHALSKQDKNQQKIQEKEQINQGIDTFFAQLLTPFLNKMMEENEALFLKIAENHMASIVKDMMHIWLEAHLPIILKERIDCYLYALDHGSKKNN